MVRIHRIHRGTDPIGAVIFVHGITGEYQDTWKASSSESDADPFWPKWLEKDFPDLSVYAFNYPSKKTNWGGASTPPPIELAGQAYECMKREEELHGLPLLFVCHSMGGLIAKFMLRDAESLSDQNAFNLIEQTRGVVFIAVPHAGARKASLARELGFVIRPSDATKDMAWNHHYLSDLKKWYGRRSQPLGIRTWAFAATDDDVVDPLSADPGVTGVSLQFRPGDHSSVCKFRSDKAELYRDICGVLDQFRQDVASTLPPDVVTGDSPKLSHSSSADSQLHGYEMTRWEEPFPECAQLHVETQQGTDRRKINATAILRCNRQRISEDQEIERAFYLSAKSIRLTIDVTGGEVDPHLGAGDHDNDGRYEFDRAANVLIWSVRDGVSFLRGTVHRGGWLPAINVRSFDECSVDMRIGAYPESINLDIVDPGHLPQPAVSDLKTKLMKIIGCRALERVDDEIILCRTEIAPGGRD